MNSYKLKIWEIVLIFAQILHLGIALTFAYQEKYPQA